MRVSDTPHNRKLKAIDLFSGCGGLTEGLKNAGFEVVAAVDLEPTAVETYKLNHKSVKVWDRDIRSLSAAEVMSELNLKKGELDLLAGCPPCQGFSSMRTKNGKKWNKDKRNDLIYDFLRLVKDLKPKTVMMENVPGLLENRRMKEFKQELEEMGYQFGDSPTVLNVKEYGVPQSRRRMILLASRYGVISLAPKAANLKTVRDTITQLKPHGKSGDLLHDLPENRTPKIAEMISKVPKDGGSRTDLDPKYHLPCHIRYPQGFKDVYGRMKWNAPSPTMTGGCISPSKGRFLHPEENRAITLREAALLQTFPVNYQFSLRNGRAGVALMIGNALPPEFIKRQALQIKKHLLAV